MVQAAAGGVMCSGVGNILMAHLLHYMKKLSTSFPIYRNVLLNICIIFFRSLYSYMHSKNAGLNTTREIWTNPGIGFYLTQHFLVYVFFAHETQ